jgi:tetratricopeptide (TPR) repeat protein
MRLPIAILVLISFALFAQKVTPEKLVAHAESLIAQQQYTESLQALNECIEKFPAFVAAYKVRGDVKEKLDKLREALSDFNIALALDPESAEILLSRAILAFKLKRFDLAKPDFRKLLYFRGTETNTVYFRQSNNEGIDNIMTVQSNIHDQMYNYLGLIDYELNDLDSAIHNFNSAIAINGKQPDYYVHRGLTYLKVGDTQKASQDFHFALRLNPDHSVSKNNLATIKRKEGNVAEAEKLLREAKLANAKAQQHHSGLALLQMESGQYAEAILNFDTAILIESKDAELFVSRGLAKEKLKDLNGAMHDYSNAIQLDDQWPKAWFMQGNIFLKKNQLTEALENYTMALSLDENYALAYHNRAITFMRIGNKKNACEDILNAEKGMIVDGTTKDKMCGN